ncbi:MAG: bifunctional riboflavin kinase/FAD synthetase [Acidimicrobiaceae bacterium]|nr:bifunctional riboflavin kinase/FAD synthetase [Acidimicrobiaceae bacterium]
MDGTESARGPARTGSAVAIGNFDGVHSGHRLLVARAIEAATEAGLRSVVLTFDRHPATVVRPASSPRLLTSAEHKLELLRATGVDEVAVLRFDAERAAETAEDFVQSVLVDDLGARVVVVGASFRFGQGHRGDVALLESMGHDLGFAVVRVELVSGDLGRGDEVVSSSRIRELIAEGRLEEATQLLGRPHEVRAVRSARVDLVLGAGEVALEVPSEILVPPAGAYSGDVATVSLDDSLVGKGRREAILTVEPASPGSADAPGAAPSSPLLSASVHAPVVVAVSLLDDAAGDGDGWPPPPGAEVAVRFVSPAGFGGQ